MLEKISTILGHSIRYLFYSAIVSQQLYTNPYIHNFISIYEIVSWIIFGGAVLIFSGILFFVFNGSKVPEKIKETVNTKRTLINKIDIAMGVFVGMCAGFVNGDASLFFVLILLPIITGIYIRVVKELIKLEAEPEEGKQ